MKISTVKSTRAGIADRELALERWEDDGGASRTVLPVPDEVAATIEAWWQAWATNNASALGELADDEYSEFSDLRKWQCVGKEALLAAAEKSFRESEVDSWSMRDLVVRGGLWHGDIVVCEYFFSISGKLHGDPFHSEGVATDVLVHRGGRWKYFSHHNSLVEERKGGTTDRSIPSK